MYDDYMSSITGEKSERAKKIINRQFPHLFKREIEDMSHNADFVSYKINHEIYCTDDVPDTVYYLIKGNVKL